MSRPAQRLARHSSMPLALLVATALAACNEPLACTDELRVSLTPTDTTLQVGEIVQPKLRLSSCGGRERLPARYAVTSPDPAIALVEPGTRRVRAVSPGFVQLSVTDSTYHVVGIVNLVVVDAP